MASPEDKPRPRSAFSGRRRRFRAEVFARNVSRRLHGWSQHPHGRHFWIAAAVPIALALVPWEAAGFGTAQAASPVTPLAMAPAHPDVLQVTASRQRSHHSTQATQTRQRLSSMARPAAAERQGPVISSYAVRAGDTLSGIAARFGTDMASLERINHLSADSILQPGQKLTVLHQIGWLYTVRSGDTLDGIASATGASPRAIARSNGMGGGGAILHIGQRLVIPKNPPVAIAAARPASAADPAPTAPPPSRGAALQWPVQGVITSPFGWRPNPWGGAGMFFHHGIDIGVPQGTLVHAACSGRVVLARWDGGYGNAVKVACNDGLLTLYAHNSRFAVHYGQLVAQGQVLAYSGMTGNATGPHVHFGVMRGGVWQNPMNYLP